MHVRRFPIPFLPLALLFVLHLYPLSVRGESPAKLGPAPRATESILPESVGPGYVRAAVAPIDTSDRSDVADAFDAVYRAAQGIAANWTGNVGSCTAGTTSQDYIDATLLRVNYYRAMVGLPGDIVFDSTFNQKCREAALMMIANGDLSHNPPPTWTCYTADGAEAAGKSNIAIGRAGAESIDLYILDSGAGNTAVGHRRWILYPPQQTMGTGSSTAVNGFFHGSNALWVLASMGTRPATPEWVAWPPAGYVPYQIVYPRWSFSYPNADFSGATIEMTHNGSPVSVTRLPVANGYGDNTVVWEPSGIPATKPAMDQDYNVTLRNVTIGGSPREFTYTVTIIDPDAVVQTPVSPEAWGGYE